MTSQPQSEQALHRIMRYLEMSGVSITPAVEKRALKLITCVLDSDPGDLLSACMALVPSAFDLPSCNVPRQAPPVQRGSLGYGDY